MSSVQRSTYDAIVIGGGPAGATAAILLAKAGHRVAIVEKATFPRRKVCGEFISGPTWALLGELGVAEELRLQAGPTVRRVGVYVESRKALAAMPLQLEQDNSGGRAVSREVLDTVLLRRAGEAGATIWQPWAVTEFGTCGSGNEMALRHNESGRAHKIEAPLVIAAHGSWESGPLPTQRFQKLARPCDLLGFKAHFRGGTLSHDLMPLISFPGGYGGMVNTSAQSVSLSCCIRRDELGRCRSRWPSRTAGEAVLCHIRQHCDGVNEVLAQATCDGSWLAAGPIRPGVRSFGTKSIFAVGNAAAEAHPVIAEGISIAIQSAALLCEALARQYETTLTPAAFETARRQYAQSWRSNFLPRMLASALYAHIFMRPFSARLAVLLMQLCPGVLRVGAGYSGKARSLRPVSSELLLSTISTFRGKR